MWCCILLFFVSAVLSLSHISILHVVVLEHLVPEACQLVAVADFYHMELLDNPAVQSQLLLLELWDDGSTQVVSHD